MLALRPLHEWMTLAAEERAGILDWTAIRPPRLIDGSRTGTYRTAITAFLPHGLTISQPDVANSMLTVLQQPETVRHSVGVAYSWAPERASKNFCGRVEIEDLRSAQRVKAPRRRCR